MSAGPAPTLDTRPVDAATAAAVEAAEAAAWADLVAAAPPAHAARLGLGAHRIGGVLVIRCGGGPLSRTPSLIRSGPSSPILSVARSTMPRGDSV